MTEKKTIGLAWYYKPQWEKVRSYSKDRVGMEKKYEDWEKKALATAAQMEADGYTVHRVYIDVDMLIAWCKRKRMPIDGKARTDYTNHLFASHMGMTEDI